MQGLQENDFANKLGIMDIHRKDVYIPSLLEIRTPNSHKHKSFEE